MGVWMVEGGCINGSRGVYRWYYVVVERVVIGCRDGLGCFETVAGWFRDGSWWV